MKSSQFFGGVDDKEEDPPGYGREFLIKTGKPDRLGMAPVRT
jgi:hypothetical protein